MIVFDEFGVLASDIEAVREAIERCVGIRFEARYGLHRGDYYLYEVDIDGELENIYLKRNLDAEYVDILIESRPYYPLLILMRNASQLRSKEITSKLREALPSLHLFDHEVVE